MNGICACIHIHTYVHQETVFGKWKGKTNVAVTVMKEGKISEDDFIEQAKVMK